MKEKNTVRNKRIIFSFVIIVVVTIFLLILFNNNFNSEIYFHYVYNQNTGECLTVLESVFLYLLLWGLAGGILASGISVFVMYVYFFLHRKDKKISYKYYTPKYQEELEYGISVAFVAAYILLLIVMILHIFNISTLSIF